MKIMFISLFFLISLSIYSENVYIKKTPNTINPANTALDNSFELGAYFNPNSKNTLVHFKGNLWFLNWKLLGEYDLDQEKTLLGMEMSTHLSRYFLIGGDYMRYQNHQFGSFGFLINTTYGYLGYTYRFNHAGMLEAIEGSELFLTENTFKHAMQVGLNLFQVSPFLNLYDMGDDIELEYGLSLLDFYGFTISYAYCHRSKGAKHQMLLSGSLPYMDASLRANEDGVSSIYASFHTKRHKQPIFEMSHYWLKVTLKGELSEIGHGGEIDGSHYSFIDLAFLLRRAVKDPYIKGILFIVDRPSLSTSQAEELLNILNGKKAYAVYLKGNGLGDYLLASSAKTSWIHPAVDLDIKGPSVSMRFYKNLLMLLGVQAHFFKRGDYKTAPEMYTKSEPSSFNKKNLEHILPVIKAWVEEKIETRLKRSFQELKKKEVENLPQEENRLAEAILDQAPYSAKRAVKLGLVDQVGYLDEMEFFLKAKEAANFIKPAVYNTLFLRKMQLQGKTDIAVLTIDGEITESKGILFGVSENYREKILKAIKEIKKSPFIDAVIVRIQSPGGSGFVSDEIHHAIETIKVPVYVSMSRVAASGGYYIAVSGKKIFANKMSVLGSIGVYTGKFVLKGLLTRLMVGIFNQPIWKNGNYDSAFAYLEDGHRAKFEESVEDFYQLFLERVSKGRGLPIKTLRDKIAGGRIYMGEEAKQLHLIDEIGGFNETLSALIQDYGFSDSVQLRAYPENNSLLYALFSSDKKLLYQMNTLVQLVKSSSLLLSDFVIEF